MPTPITDNTPFTNRILAALPRKEQDRLLPHLEVVTLGRGQVLHEAGGTIRHAYFPETALISLLSIAEEGTIIEVGLLGNGIGPDRKKMGAPTLACDRTGSEQVSLPPLGN